MNTERLIIRPFRRDDLAEIHRILRESFAASEPDAPAALAARGRWLEWNALSSEWFPRLGQPPYGDRALILAASGGAPDIVIGVVGFVPLLMPFDQIPELARHPGPVVSGAMSAEAGLFWAVDPLRQGRGYATEAAAALIAHAFDRLKLWRILATTEYDNYASQAVMRKAGMTLTRNPRPDPPWLQVIGVCYAHPPAADAFLQPPGGLTG